MPEYGTSDLFIQAQGYQAALVAQWVKTLNVTDDIARLPTQIQHSRLAGVAGRESYFCSKFRTNRFWGQGTIYL
jgi:hypothetical protein